MLGRFGIILLALALLFGCGRPWCFGPFGNCDKSAAPQSTGGTSSTANKVRITTDLNPLTGTSPGGRIRLSATGGTSPYTFLFVRNLSSAASFVTGTQGSDSIEVLLPSINSVTIVQATDSNANTKNIGITVFDSGPRATKPDSSLNPGDRTTLTGSCSITCTFQMVVGSGTLDTTTNQYTAPSQPGVDVLNVCSGSDCRLFAITTANL